MRTVWMVMLAGSLAGCLADASGEGEIERSTCVDASDCLGGEFCAISADRGTCRVLPAACGPVGDCTDPICADALEQLCVDGEEAVRCANPIDPSSTVVGSPAFTCG
ncbi:MAG: hypothetical protein ACI8PZ_001282 [Myxococcota bacterium]|jgi:hypothetical protein